MRTQSAGRYERRNGGAVLAGVPSAVAPPVGDHRIPPRALVIAAAALAIPVLATELFPEWTDRDGALLIWLPALVPAFLLAYYKGWRGASLALAAGMAALALSQTGILALQLSVPRWSTVFAVVSLLVWVSLGVGWLAELLLRTREAAEAAAFTDPLTGLANRRHALAVLDRAWAMASRGHGLSLVLFDLDHFKGVNDTHGHAEGDRVLRAFADVLQARTRQMDLSARFGGEEFLTLLIDASADVAVAFAESVRREMARVSFGWGAVTVSAGVAEVEPGMGSPDILIAAADRALYRAKDEGRDCVRVAGDRLGRADQAPLGTAPAPRPTRSIQECRVLVVDDDPGSLASTARVLERLGAEVRTASEPREGLRMLVDNGPFDLLVTDIVMPEMSGFTLVDLAMRARPDLAVLYMSGYPQEEVYWGGTPGARSSFLSKPFEIAEMKDRVERLLRGDAPRVAPVPAAAPAGASRAGAQEGDVALVLSAAPEVGEELARVLREAGAARAVVVTDVQAAREGLRQGNVELLVVDLDGCGEDALALVEDTARQAEGGEYLPILVATHARGSDLCRRALEAGASDVLSRPLHIESAVRIRNLLAVRRLNREVARQRDALEVAVRQRTAELADTRTEILHRLARVGEYRDDVTGRHAERVGLMASLIASELGLSTREVDMIRRTAPLHDIGKVAIPDAILLKPGPLTHAEFDLMKRHTIIGEEILGGSAHEILIVASRIAAAHHERWDGTGYPGGRKGEEIPLEARIVAVSDVFDVLTHARPYRSPTQLPEAIAEIERSIGTHFDPDVGEAFLRLCRRVGPDGLLEAADPLDPTQDVVFLPGG